MPKVSMGKQPMNIEQQINTGPGEDLIYTYKEPEHGGIELKYSIRSAHKNLTYRNLIIIGDKPKNLAGYIHIPATDNHTKGRNTFYKIHKICAQGWISQNWIWANDDFYIQKPYKKIPYLWTQTLAQAEKKYNEGDYVNRIRRTKQRIGNQKMFEPHFPFVFNTQKLVKLIIKYQLPQGGMLRTLYAHEYKIKGTKIQDTKARTETELEQVKKKPFFSTTDKLAQTEQYIKIMEEAFPEPSPYETI